MSDLKAGDRVRLMNGVGKCAEAGALATCIGRTSTGRADIKWDRSSHPGQDHDQHDGGYDHADFQKIDGPFVIGDMVKVVNEEDCHYEEFGMVVRHDGDDAFPWRVCIDGSEDFFDTEELELAVALVKPEETKASEAPKFAVGDRVKGIAAHDGDWFVGKTGKVMSWEDSASDRGRVAAEVEFEDHGGKGHAGYMNDGRKSRWFFRGPAVLRCIEKLPESTKATFKVGDHVEIKEPHRHAGRKGLITEHDGDEEGYIPWRVLFDGDGLSGDVTWVNAAKMKLVTEETSATPDPKFIVIDSDDEITGVHSSYAEALADARAAAEATSETYEVYKKVAVAQHKSEVIVTEF